ncbi:hypothetical protein OIU79_011136 [Salix purpurea]|uniref:Uncharacterized protein n=1 Tax=Salix purpurea TaxID=77065 RepID=A0A9Q0QHW8_SALPP|nr:hypothetical protein OIU79_011136 [Salix purpurea]
MVGAAVGRRSLASSPSLSFSGR